jgi:hypothetical protein
MVQTCSNRRSYIQKKTHKKPSKVAKSRFFSRQSLQDQTSPTNQRSQALEVAGNLFVQNQELRQEVANREEFSIVSFEEFRKEKEELERKKKEIEEERQSCVDEWAKAQKESWYAQIKVLDLERQVNRKDNEIGHLKEIEQSNQTLHEKVQRLIFDKSQLETTLIRIRAERTDGLRRVDRLHSRVEDLEGWLRTANAENARLQEHLRQQREGDGGDEFFE